MIKWWLDDKTPQLAPVLNALVVWTCIPRLSHAAAYLHRGGRWHHQRPESECFFSFLLLPRGPLPPELFDYVAEMSRPEGEQESLTPASGWRGTFRSDDEDLPGNNPIWWQSWAMRLRFFASVGNKYYHHWLSTRATNNTARHFSVFFDFHSLEMFYNIRKIGNSSK